MKRLLFFLLLSTYAQAQLDTLHTLPEFTVKGYESKKKSIITAASIHAIGTAEIQRYALSDPLPLFNAYPGVRLEERSPGSYRLALRGSSLRSPYGVRNVKIYFNGIPLTDANGTSYLNLMDFNTLGQIEIMKGPTGSTFGAGNGGVVQLNTSSTTHGHEIKAGVQLGDYNTLNYSAQYQYGSDQYQITAAYSSRSSDGYRDHSNSKGQNLTLAGSYRPNKKHQLNLSFVYASTDYQTPGGLTLAQMQDNRKASRPATPTLPSSKQQQAGIIQDFLLAGLQHHWDVGSGFTWSNSLFLSSNDLQNPFITSYEFREERTGGYRSVLEKKIKDWTWTLGSEGIFTSSNFDVKQNNLGTPGVQQYFTDLDARQLTHFLQGQYVLLEKTFITAGISYNTQYYHNITAPLDVEGRPGTPWTPRFSILHALTPGKSIYYSFTQGYSPPTAQEMTANYEYNKNLGLAAEKGIGHELGIKARWTRHLQSELSLYHQNIKDALVRMVTEDGGEYFLNTGEIIQRGIEWSNRFNGKLGKNLFLEAYANANFNKYTFADFVNEGVDLKGNKLPGIPDTEIALGIRMNHRSGIFLNSDFGRQSSMFLTNKNEAKTEPFWTSRARIGWQGKISPSLSLQVFGGVDNLLNKEYALGYDFNAVGNRFYNPSPTRNWNGGAYLKFRI